MWKEVGYVVLSIWGPSSAFVIGMFISEIRKMKKDTRDELNRIDESVQEELKNIHAAEAVIIDRIHRGYYNNMTMDEMLADFKFERIVQPMKGEIGD